MFVSILSKIFNHSTVDITWRDFAIEFFWFKRCGLISISWGVWALHLGVQPSHWRFGHSIESYDSCIDYWGLGPIFLLARLN